VLRLPVTAAYHTDPQAAAPLSGANAFVAQATRKYLVWFYSRADRVIASSPAARDALIEMGVSSDRITALPPAAEPAVVESAQPRHGKQVGSSAAH
jgi:hypothetical protein